MPFKRYQYIVIASNLLVSPINYNVCGEDNAELRGHCYLNFPFCIYSHTNERFKIHGVFHAFITLGAIANKERSCYEY